MADRQGIQSRLAIVTDIMAPYRIPLLNAVAARFGSGLVVFFMGDRTSNRLWRAVTAEALFDYRVIPGREISGDPGLGFNRFWNPGMYSALSEFDPDVVVIGGYHHPTSYAVLAWTRLHRRKLVLWSESTSFDIRPSSRVRGAIKKWFLRNCAACIVPGTASERYLLSLGVPREGIFRSPNSIDIEKFISTSAPFRSLASRLEFREKHGLPAFLILFVGRLSPEKGFLDVVEAAARLQATGRDVGVVVVGDGEMRAGYESEATRRLSERSVLFTGFVQQDELPFYYASADALMVPSLSEPWGFVVQEAQVCGLPVVCSEHVGAGYDLITEGETGFMRSDADGYFEALARLVDDSSERARIGESGFALARQLDPESAAEGFVELMEDARLRCDKRI